MDKNYDINNKFLFEITLESFELAPLIIPENVYLHHSDKNIELYLFGSFISKIKLDNSFFDQLDDNFENALNYLKGDFLLIFVNKKDRVISFVNDKNGKYRGYFSLSNGKFKLSNHFASLVESGDNFKLSNRGIYQILNSNYLTDPDTLSKQINVLPIGCYALYKNRKIEIKKYYDAINFEVDLFESETQCVKGLDNSLIDVFSQRYGGMSEPPIVMLSGGIDSLLIMNYLREIGFNKIKTITFAVKGIPNDDLIAARKAAKYFNSEHYEVQIDPYKSWDYFLDALQHGNSFTYSNIINGAIKDRLDDLGEYKSVLITGQDTRLPSPGVDNGYFIGFKRNVSRISLTPSEQIMWMGAHTLKRWKGKGSSIIDSFIQKGKKYDSNEIYFDYLLRQGLHFRGNHFNRSDFYKEGFAKKSFSSDLNLFKSTVSHFFLSQCTDNMNEYVNYLEASGHRVDYPFVDSDLVSTANRIPIEISAKPIFTFKSGSLIPISRKYLLRKLVAGKIPDELLWRRKATPFTASALFSSDFRYKMKLVSNQYASNLLNNPTLDDINRISIERILHQSLDNSKMNLNLIEGSNLIKVVYLIFINEIMNKQNTNILSNLRNLD